MYPTVKCALGTGRRARVVVGARRLRARRGRGSPVMTDDPAATFEPHRRRLRGLAYRMLGSMAGPTTPCRPTCAGTPSIARASAMPAPSDDDDHALCLDVLKSARATRKCMGPWLPTRGFSVTGARRADGTRR
jgi:hypothetical protein